MLETIMAVAAVSDVGVDQRAGAANVAARIFAAPGRVDEHTVKRRVRRPRHRRRQGQVRDQADRPISIYASKFKGTDVIGSDDEKIGDVSDILFDKDNKVIAFIVGVGGFLGIGAKDVAIDPASFQLVPGKDATDMKLRLSMTKDELKAAPAFEPYQPPRPVQQPGPGTRPMGAPAPMAPTPKQ